MKTFREIVTEGLVYTMEEPGLDKILKDNDYKRMSKGGKFEKIRLFGDGKNVLFNHNKETNQLTVLKQGWQLMNVKRGY